MKKREEIRNEKKRKYKFEGIWLDGVSGRISVGEHIELCWEQRGLSWSKDMVRTFIDEGVYNREMEAFV